MAEDIVPALLESLKKEFSSEVKKNRTLASLAESAANGTATYADAYKYAEIMGSIQARVYKRMITDQVMPDGKMYYNIAERVFQDTLTTLHNDVSDFAVQVQSILNKKAKIGLKAIKPDVDESLIEGIVNRVSSEEAVSDVAWILDEPIKVYSLKQVDSTIEANAEFQHRAGVRATVSRIAAWKCCDWCSAKAGSYTYPGVPRDVFARHENCRCTLNYNGSKMRNSGHAFVG